MPAILLTLAMLVVCLSSTSPAKLPVAQTPPVPPGQVFEPGSWTIAVMPDIQSYCDHRMRMPLLDQMTAWIVANKQPLNIQLVLQEGDIVFQNGVAFAAQSTGDQNSAQQWRNARKAFRVLDGVLPYILVPGNHDFGIGNAESRKTQFIDFFNFRSNPLVDPDRGGILVELGPSASLGKSIENAAYELSAPDGRKLLILALEFGPRQSVVDWAKAVAAREQYHDYTKVLLTHAYLYHDNTRYDWAAKGDKQSNNPHDYSGVAHDTHDGEELWDELVDAVPGFELVICGHVGGDSVGYLCSPSSSGGRVHQLLFNAQFLPLGGQGWLRLLTFLPDAKTVHVRTFSPYFALDDDPATAAWRIGADDDFIIELSPVAN